MLPIFLVVLLGKEVLRELVPEILADLENGLILEFVQLNNIGESLLDKEQELLFLDISQTVIVVYVVFDNCFMGLEEIGEKISQGLTKLVEDLDLISTLFLDFFSLHIEGG